MIEKNNGSDEPDNIGDYAGHSNYNRIGSLLSEPQIN